LRCSFIKATLLDQAAAPRPLSTRETYYTQTAISIGLSNQSRGILAFEVGEAPRQLRRLDPTVKPAGDRNS
jgi:hypothetical protein